MIRGWVASLRRNAARWRKAAAQMRRHREILEQLDDDLEQRDGGTAKHVADGLEEPPKRRGR